MIGKIHGSCLQCFVGIQDERTITFQPICGRDKGLSIVNNSSYLQLKGSIVVLVTQNGKQMPSCYWRNIVMGFQERPDMGKAGEELAENFPF